MTPQLIHVVLSPVFLAFCVLAFLMGQDSAGKARRRAYAVGLVGMLLFGLSTVLLALGFTQVLVVFFPAVFAWLYWSSWVAFYFAAIALVWAGLAARKEARSAS